MTGCTHLCFMSPEQLQLASNENLCTAYASCKSQAIRRELTNRNLFTMKEWQHIDTESLYMGMSKLAMLAMVQNVYFNALKTTKDGTVEQWKTPGHYVNLYIHLLDNKVISWSMF